MSPSRGVLVLARSGRLAAGLRYAAVASVALVLAGCSGTAASSPAEKPKSTGSLQVSGAISGTLTETASQSGIACTAGNGQFNGTVQFDGDGTRLVLTFLGGPGTTSLPLPGNKPPAIVSIRDSKGATWSAGQVAPTSHGELTLSSGPGTGVQGSLNAALAPGREGASTLEAHGEWVC